MIGVVLVVVPLLVDRFGAEVGRGVVALDDPWILLLQIEGVGDAAQQRVEGGVLDQAGSAERGKITPPLPPIELGKEPAPVAEPLLREVEPHVFLEAKPATGHERCIGGAEVASGGEVAEVGDWRAGILDHGRGEEGDVRRHRRGRAIGPGDPRVEGAEIGPIGRRADDRLDVVVAVAGDERADDVDQVRPLGKLGKGRAEGDAGDRGGDRAGLGMGVRRPFCFRVKRLELRRAAVHEEENHRAVAEKPSRGIVRGGRGDAGGRLANQAREAGKPCQAGAADTEERTPGQPATIPYRIANREHRPPPPREG